MSPAPLRYADSRLVGGRFDVGQCSSAVRSGWLEARSRSRRSHVSPARAPPAPVQHEAIRRGDRRRLGDKRPGRCDRYRWSPGGRCSRRSRDYGAGPARVGVLPRSATSSPSPPSPPPSRGSTVTGALAASGDEVPAPPGPGGCQGTRVPYPVGASQPARVLAPGDDRGRSARSRTYPD
jgi:hypothetical protein